MKPSSARWHAASQVSSLNHRRDTETQRKVFFAECRLKRVSSVQHPFASHARAKSEARSIHPARKSSAIINIQCASVLGFAANCARRKLRRSSPRGSASRGVAQPGRAPGSGPGGRRFKSSLPDQSFQSVKRYFWFSRYIAVVDFVDGRVFRFFKFNIWKNTPSNVAQGSPA